MKRLLILSCSLRKKASIEKLPAIQRYDGVFFRVLHKALREGWVSKNLEVLILSARYGLLHADEQIPNYDQKLTEKQIANLQPRVEEELRHYLRRHKYSSVFVNLGKAYQPLVANVSELKRATWAHGGSGKRAQMLKAWIQDNE